MSKTYRDIVVEQVKTDNLEMSPVNLGVNNSAHTSNSIVLGVNAVTSGADYIALGQGQTVVSGQADPLTHLLSVNIGNVFYYLPLIEDV